MSMVGWKKQRGCVVGLLVLMSPLFLLTQSIVTRQSITGSNSQPVQLQILDGYIVVDNGLARITFSNPDGMVTGINYNGIKNILEDRNKETNRGYWDVSWSKIEVPGNMQDKLKGTNFRVIMQTEDQVELSFIKTYIPPINGTRLPLIDTSLPLNIDKRYIVLRGVPGFYSYATFQRLKGWRNMKLIQARIAFKLRQNLFRYMAVSDNRQRIMPTPQERKRGRRLAYPEAVRLTDQISTDNVLIREVDDKYQYSAENKDNRVHGWICSNPATGFWVITPSSEFRAGGPLKQDLTSHVGPTSLSMLFSPHYSGRPLHIIFGEGEPWKKVFGPVFIYLNSGLVDTNPLSLWQDAKLQMLIETESWPYNFPRSNDYSFATKRGRVIGRLLVEDRYANKTWKTAKFAYVGLAQPGVKGSWQTESKGYQFWTRADVNGYFWIENVLSGTYNLYAWVPGFIGDYKYEFTIAVAPGNIIRLWNIVYVPPRNGPTLWEIGVPDRTAAEFFVPRPNPLLTNKLYDQDTAERFRQYGLWDRYTDLYPTEDLVFDVCANIYQRDWFFAHVNRKLGNNNYVPTTWKIIFDLIQVEKTRSYTLQLALASASGAELQVRINNRGAEVPHFTTGLIGKDNAIARHGIHGLYRLYSVNISGNLLQSGNNIIFLTQSRGGSPFNGFMYDYIRLEQPPATT